MDKSFPTIQGFEILKLVGKGGMGTVYLARQLSLNRPVAIKILPAYLAANPTYVMRFRQEARAAAKVKHPGLVQIFDAGEEQGLFYYVMEYINGETTAQRLARKGRLDEASALLIAESVAVALEHAWSEARLVHRDIKPDNILIDEDGTVKVADLGLAKMIDQTAMAITIAHSLIGTPHYCAPEQARGESQVDCRADIYALGATLYHYIVGYAPFADTPGVSAMVRSLTDYVPDPMDCCPDVSEHTAWLIEKMMARDRNDRQRNWHEALDDIDQVMSGRPPLSPPPPRASTVLRSERRGRSGSVGQASPERLLRRPDSDGDYGGQVAQSRAFRPGEKKPSSIMAAMPPPLPAVKEETAEDSDPSMGATSRRFRIFLSLAAVFTILLYLIWFRMDKEARSRSAPAPTVLTTEQTVAPQNSQKSKAGKFNWRKRIRRFRP